MKNWLLLLLFWLPAVQYAQTESPHIVPEAEVHSQASYFRAAVLIGHTLITPGNATTRLFVPSWGLDFEYWSRGRFGVGVHTDVEIQDFVILNDDEEEIERNEPLILTLDGLYSPIHGLILLAGPGLELEEGHPVGLVRIGVEYEINIGKSFDIFPTLFYDQRFNDYATLTVGLGVGKVL